MNKDLIELVKHLKNIYQENIKTLKLIDINLKYSELEYPQKDALYALETETNKIQTMLHDQINNLESEI